MVEPGSSRSTSRASAELEITRRRRGATVVADPVAVLHVTSAKAPRCSPSAPAASTSAFAFAFTLVHYLTFVAHHLLSTFLLGGFIY
jgi:hypothetical protein